MGQAARAQAPPTWTPNKPLFPSFFSHFMPSFPVSVEEGGRVHFETSGSHYEEVRRRATSGQRQFAGKTAIECEIEEIFQENGGDGGA